MSSSYRTGSHALELYDNRYDVVTGEFDDANTYRNLAGGQGGVGRSARRGSAEYEHRLYGARSRAVDPARRQCGESGGHEHPHAGGVRPRLLVYRDAWAEPCPPRLRDPRPVEHHRPVRDVVPCRGAGHPHRVHGATLRECGFRERFGLNVAGLWEGNSYMSARPDSRIDEASILLLAGTADQLEAYDRKAERSSKANRTPVLILGGGKVGEAAADALERRGLPFCLVEKNPRLVPPDDPRYILGNARGTGGAPAGAHHGNPVRHRDHA